MRTFAIVAALLLLTGCFQTTRENSAAIMVVNANPATGVVLQLPGPESDEENTARWLEVLALLREIREAIPESPDDSSPDS